MNLVPAIRSLIVFLYAFLRGTTVVPWCPWGKVSSAVVQLLISIKCLIYEQQSHSFVVTDLLILLLIYLTFSMLLSGFSFLRTVYIGDRLRLLELVPENHEVRKI